MAGTVLVNLKKGWFSPDGSLYEVVDNPHEFPAEWAEKPSKEQKEKNPDQTYAVLPSTAEVLDGDPTVVAVIHKTGGGQEVTVPTAVEDDVKSVGGALDEKGIEKPSQSIAKAEKGAEELGLDQVGGKPRESGPLPAGEKK
jgi:hypothetical protein